MANGAVITNGGRQLMWKRMYSLDSSTAVSRVRVGTGTTTPTVADTALGTDLGGVGYVSLAGTYLNTTDNKVVSTAQLGSAVGNGSTISEIGEFNTDGTPVMTSHDVFTGIAKTSSKILNFTITHQLTT